MQTSLVLRIFAWLSLVSGFIICVFVSPRTADFQIPKLFEIKLFLSITSGFSGVFLFVFCMAFADILKGIQSLIENVKMNTIVMSKLFPKFFQDENPADVSDKVQNDLSSQSKLNEKYDSICNSCGHLFTKIYDLCPNCGSKDIQSSDKQKESDPT